MNKFLKPVLAVLAMVMVAVVAITTATESEAASAYNVSFATAASAKIVDGNTVGYTATLPSVPASDNGMLYLYAMPVYAYDITAECTVVGQAPASANPSFTFALNHKQASTRLYQKFGLCTMAGGKPVLIAQPQYITNPEVLATATHARKPYPLKGMQGVDFGNLPLAPSIEAIFANKESCQFLYPIVCIYSNGQDQAITNPYSRVGVKDSHYTNHDNYMMNCADATGVALLSSKMEYYTTYAINTDDWVIGNEVNERVCNYTSWIGWDEFMRQYEQVFRVCYNAIKSTNANAGVYISLDQKWMAASDFTFINGKDFIDRFAADMKAGGDIDWSITQHPYTAPLIYAKFWDMSGCPNGNYFKGLVANNKYITFQNLGAFTSYISQPQFLNPQGQVRNLMLSEIGITSRQGASVQAATMCASYVAAASQPSVKRIIYVNHDMGFGAGLTAEAVDMYNNMDGANSAAYQQKAMATIGISNWAQVLR